jgi:hypothetical protein
MRKTNVLLWVMMVVCLTLTACSGTKKPEFEISDLNGTWIDHYRYEHFHGTQEGEIPYSEMEFSWGIGLTLPNTTFAIDMNLDPPELLAAVNGLFRVTQAKKESRDTITMFVYQGSSDRLRWETTIEFQFADKDTLWIDSDITDEWVDTNVTKDPNSTKTLWHRLSGP